MTTTETMRIVPPRRRTYEFVQHLNGSPADVFPLLCPVRERDWVPGWEPGLVISASGVAEAGCVFTTPDGTSSSGVARDALWVVTEHDAIGRTVAMVKVSPGYLVTRLWVAVSPGDSPLSSVARVTYEYTALGLDGDAFVDQQTPEKWAAFMDGWERSLNTYLRGGSSQAS